MKSSLYDLTGKAAVVTGGVNGVGLAVVNLLAEHGADIVVAGKSAAECEEVANQVRQMGRQALACPIDISDTAQCANLIKKAADTFGRIDIFVAGECECSNAYITDMTESEWDNVLDVNLKGTFFLAKEIGKVMIQQKSGSIITLASSANYVAFKKSSAYMATSAAISNITAAMAMEWTKYNIRANTIAVGLVDTERTQRLMSADEKAQKHLSKRIAMKRLGKPEEIAYAALFFASEASSFVTGITMLVDGGLRIL